MIDLKQIDKDKIPENYKELVEKSIISDIEFKLGKNQIYR